MSITFNNGTTAFKEASIETLGSVLAKEHKSEPTYAISLYRAETDVDIPTKTFEVSKEDVRAIYEAVLRVSASAGEKAEDVPIKGAGGQLIEARVDYDTGHTFIELLDLECKLFVFNFDKVNVTVVEGGTLKDTENILMCYTDHDE